MSKKYAFQAILTVCTPQMQPIDVNVNIAVKCQINLSSLVLLEWSIYYNKLLSHSICNVFEKNE